MFICSLDFIDSRGREDVPDTIKQAVAMDTSSVYTEESDTDQTEPTIQPQVRWLIKIDFVLNQTNRHCSTKVT